MIKMILSDLDHTLLRQDGSISDETLRILQRCREKGVLFAVATARYWIGAENCIRQLNPDYEITTDGTLVHARGECIYSCCFTAEETNAIIRNILSAVPDAEITAACGKVVYWNSRHIAESERLHKAVFRDYSSPMTTGANKIVAELPDESTARQIAEKTGNCRLQCYRGEKWYAFLPAESGKARAIRALAEASGVSTEEFAAFGDDSNDVEMLKICGTGVAVANAVPEALDAADEITLSNDMDGVALWLNCRCLYHSLLSATFNTRDLGGYPAAEGRETVRNRIWRSDAPTDWDETDEKRMKDLGITTVIDLRTERGVRKKPCAYAGRDGFTYYNIPISTGSIPPDTLEEVPLSYMEIAGRKEAAEVFRIIAGADGGVLICCTAGKDRTGVVSALLLLACGADRRTVVEDYALSREYNRLRLEKFLAEHPEVDRKIVLANEASMEKFIDLFTERFGSMENYFRQAGLSPEHLAGIRRKLLREQA